MTSLTSFLPDRRRLRILRKAPELIRPASPRPQRRDCQGQLLAALQDRARGDSIVEDAAMRPWCSATFLGARHRIRMRFDGADAAERAALFADGLSEAEFTLHGHIVADATVEAIHPGDADGIAVSIAILTIEDW